MIVKKGLFWGVNMDSISLSYLGENPKFAKILSCKPIN